MWEMLYIASGLRCPIVMANANRALAAPINIHCDHSRRHGRAGRGLDHLVRRDGAGGLRQHAHLGPHRRAPRRAAAGDDHARRLHHHPLHRSRPDHGRRDGQGVRRRVRRPSSRCSTTSNPVSPRQLRRSRRHVLRVQEGRSAWRFDSRDADRQADRRRVGGDLRPPVRGRRELGHGGRRGRHRRHRLHRRQRAPRRARASRRRREGRRRQDPRVPAVPGRASSPRRSRASRPSA